MRYALAWLGAITVSVCCWVLTARTAAQTCVSETPGAARLGVPVLEPPMAPKLAQAAEPPKLTPSQPEATDPQLPINLATALRLADARPLIIQYAAASVQTQAGRLLQAQALWLPTLRLGIDYQRHDGAIQGASGDNLYDNGKEQFLLGAGPSRNHWFGQRGTGKGAWQRRSSAVMPLLPFDALFEFADALGQPSPIVVAGGADATMLQALRAACDRGWIAPLVVGDEADVRQTASDCGVALHGFSLINASDPAGAAVALVRSQQACLLMKGQISTPSLMKAMLDPATGLRTGRTICQVVLMELAHGERRFLLADTGVCIQPTLPQKIDILQSAVDLAHSLGVDCPRVASLAATETRVASMPETLDAAELERLNRAGEISGCVVRGPLSFDLAVDADAAAKKKRHDPAFGVADILLFPNLLSANLTVKAIMYTAECRFGGVLVGASCPVVFMSRADTTATRLYSLALALNISASCKPAAHGVQ
jgi:phosphate butyryltransferase